MGNLYENIKKLCGEKGVSPSGVCVELGISKNVISSLKKGRTSSLSAANLQAFADYFGVSVDELLGSRKDVMYSFNDVQTGITVEIKGYDGRLSETKKKMLDAYMEAFKKVVESTKNG